jgi:hypothetical protein
MPSDKIVNERAYVPRNKKSQKYIHPLGFFMKNEGRKVPWKKNSLVEKTQSRRKRARRTDDCP